MTARLQHGPPKRVAQDHHADQRADQDRRGCQARAAAAAGGARHCASPTPRSKPRRGERAGSGAPSLVQTTHVHPPASKRAIVPERVLGPRQDSPPTQPTRRVQGCTTCPAQRSLAGKCLPLQHLRNTREQSALRRALQAAQRVSRGKCYAKSPLIAMCGTGNEVERRRRCQASYPGGNELKPYYGRLVATGP